MRVLMLFSGDDKAFKDSGFQYPKNLTEIGGTPMIENVMRCFSDVLGCADEILLTMRQQEIDRYHTSSVAKLLYPKVKIVSVPNITKGAACAVLLAIASIDNSDELLVINGDIIIEQSIMPAIDDFRKRKLDGGVVTFESVHPRWSFVKCDETGQIIEATEKRPISKNATVGVYYFKHGKDYVEAAENMIRKDAAVNGSFYICPAFNELVLMQKKLGIYQIDRDNYYSLASPSGVEAYEKHLEG
ncbi:nucleotidyl transferase [Butyrivibrio proteoclasticus B316]|uniref:Nucleotidyl transferase n=1 Tax=Butyrivibrio proteoclasticus (strain ATCC 51982 / DSM 14932 / B316) TaxID=515622 RepID=E0RW29_BUTPB|nr:glycosyltransferase family 2 protein [Butyrivibrio proteoclasticus]ADL32895.1 nucleotidyl transferase [Butyrivibrio proteoclasticus B316]